MDAHSPAGSSSRTRTTACSALLEREREMEMEIAAAQRRRKERRHNPHCTLECFFSFLFFSFRRTGTATAQGTHARDYLFFSFSWAHKQSNYSLLLYVRFMLLLTYCTSLPLDRKQILLDPHVNDTNTMQLSQRILFSLNDVVGSTYLAIFFAQLKLGYLLANRPILYIHYRSIVFG